MAIDTPAKIAVLGAGPLGLEAALYARFLGYEVDIYERGGVAARVLESGHARLLSPFGLCRSTLGLAALEAHDEHFSPPADDEFLTGREWVERYLLPLAHTDLIADHLRLGCEVRFVGKDEILRNDLPGDPDRGDWDFRLLVRNSAGTEEIHKADAVLDATGTAVPNWLGQGGIPAAGELALREVIEFGLPDVLGNSNKFAGRRTLVIGSGCSAATTILALSQLAAQSPGTQICWLTRREASDGIGPVRLVAGDPLLQRTQLVEAVNRLATAGNESLVWRPATFIDQISRDPAGLFHVVASGLHAGKYEFDNIVANVGHRADERLFRELQSAPPEPNFHVLSARPPHEASFAAGLARIRDVFAIIGDRHDLDLYEGAQKLMRQAR